MICGTAIASGGVAMLEGAAIELSHASNLFLSCAGALCLYGTLRCCGRNFF
jgi:hypothetical protein